LDLRKRKEKRGGNKMALITRSKTLDFNILVGAIFAGLLAFGIKVPPEAIAAVSTLGNFILRFFTKMSLADKKRFR
jgi:hypothetical protein